MFNCCHFVDIDGTIFYHAGDLQKIVELEPQILPGVLEKFLEWRSKGDTIIITTARPEGLRELTIRQLYSVGLFWDQLIMGLPLGPRIVYNDRSTYGGGSHNRAFAANFDRNRGLVGIEEYVT